MRIGRAVSQLTEIRKRATHALISIVPVAERQESWERFKWAHFRIQATEDALWRALYQIVAAQRQTEAAEQAGRQPPHSARSPLIDVTFGDAAPASSSPAAAKASADACEALAAWRQAVHAADQTSTADRSLPSGQGEAGPWGWGWRRSHGQKVRRGGRAVRWPPLTLPDTWIRRMTGTSGPPCARTFT